MDQGLIFLNRGDPLSKIITKLTRDEFTSLGFYYTTTVSGNTQQSVIYFDILGLENITTTLEELKRFPLIKRLARRRLEVDPATFRAVLAEKLPPTSLEQGPRISSILKFLDEESVSSPTFTVVRSILDSLNIRIGEGTDRGRMGPLLEPHPLIGELQEIPLSTWSETEIELSTNTTLIQQRPLIHKIGGLLLELSLTAPSTSGIARVFGPAGQIESSGPVSNSGSIESSDYRKSIKILYDQGRGWLENIRNSEPVWISINPVLAAINMLGKNIVSELPLLRTAGSYYSIVYTNNSSKKIPVILRTGNKIELPLHNRNLTGLEVVVLEELLEVLETLSSSSSEYDELRAAISEQLASK